MTHYLLVGKMLNISGFNFQVIVNTLESPPCNRRKPTELKKFVYKGKVEPKSSRYRITGSKMMLRDS